MSTMREKFQNWWNGYETTEYGRQKQKGKGNKLESVLKAPPQPPPSKLQPSLNIPYETPQPPTIDLADKLALITLWEDVEQYRNFSMNVFWPRSLEDAFSDVNRILEAFFTTAGLNGTNGTIAYSLLDQYLLELSEKATKLLTEDQGQLAIKFANFVFQAIRLTQPLTEWIDREWEYDNNNQTSVNFWKKGGPRGSFPSGPRTA